MDKFGFLYITDCMKNEVRKWKIGEKDQKGTLIASGNGKENNLNQMSYSSYIFVDEEESVYVSDSEIHRVVKWKKNAKEGVIVAGGNGEENNLNQLFGPRGLFVDQWKQIYIVDSRNNRIMRWCEREEQGEIIVGRNGEGNQLYHPEDLSFDFEGNLYIADWFNHRIQKFEIIS